MAATRPRYRALHRASAVQRWLTWFRCGALIVALALAATPIGMAGMGASHAQMMAMGETSPCDDCANTHSGKAPHHVDGTAACVAACAALPAVLPSHQPALPETPAVLELSLSPFPSGRPVGFDPPPPRFS